MDSYGYNDGRLLLRHKKAVFDLCIRKPVTQIYGDSATGKTLLAECIRTSEKSKKYNGFSINDVSNVFVFDNGLSGDDLNKLSGALVVLDRCDLWLTDEIADCIVADRRNNYLVFSRLPFSFGLSPNYYGEFVRDGNLITIKYRWNERSWF